jgi:hypothetical protein
MSIKEHISSLETDKIRLALDIKELENTRVEM